MSALTFPADPGVHGLLMAFHPPKFTPDSLVEEIDPFGSLPSKTRINEPRGHQHRAVGLLPDDVTKEKYTNETRLQIEDQQKSLA